MGLPAMPDPGIADFEREEISISSVSGADPTSDLEVPQVCLEASSHL